MGLSKNDESFKHASIPWIYILLLERSEIMKDQRISYFLNLGDKELSEEDKVELQMIVKELQEKYDEGHPLISDSEYDILQELLVYEGEIRSSSESNDYGVRKKHPIDIMRGTLGKVYYLTDDEPRKNKSRKSLPEWIRSTQESLNPYGINLLDEPVVVTAKYDGMSCCLYVNDKGECLWLTRGNTDTNEGVDISHIMQHMQVEKIPNTATQFELLIENDKLDELNERYSTDYKNTRALTAGIVRTKEMDYRAQFIIPIPLKLYQNGKLEIHPAQFTKYPSIKCTLRDIDKIRQFAEMNRNVMGKFRTDGAVITLMSPRVREILGRKDNINQWEVAYKFTEEAAYSTIRDILFQVSDFGIVTPVALIHPIKLKGNTINRISLHNLDRFNELNLKEGDKVRVLYDIIPYCDLDKVCVYENQNRRGVPIPFPTTCPECGKKLFFDGARALCVNPECPAVRLGKLINYLESLNCKGIGPKTVRQLHELGVLNDIPTLYHLGSIKQARVIRDAHGFGELKLKLILTEVNKIRNLWDYEFFAALGFLGLNKQFFRALFAVYPLELFLDDIEKKEWNTIYQKAYSVHGIGDNKASQLVDNLKQNKSLIKRCVKYVNLKRSYGIQSSKKGVVFTGFRDPILASTFEKKGYQYQENVTKDTALVVTKDPFSNSGSVQKARARNIPLKSLREIVEGGIPDA